MRFSDIWGDRLVGWGAGGVRVFEDFVREMTPEERAEAEGLVEKARAAVFPTLWTRVVHAVFAFGVLKATSLFCCFPSVGGALAFFGIRNVWVELALVAAAAVALGWAWRSVERDGRERAAEYLQQVIDDVAEGMVRETRWKADRVWRLSWPDDYEVQQETLCRIERLGAVDRGSGDGDRFLAVESGWHPPSAGRASRGILVAKRGVVVRLPRTRASLVCSCGFDDWVAARHIQLDSECGDGVLGLGDLGESTRIQVRADVLVEPHAAPAVDPHRFHALRLSLGWLAWLIAISVALLPIGFVVGLLLFSDVGSAIRVGIATGALMLAIGLVVLFALLLVFGIGQLVRRAALRFRAVGGWYRVFCWSESFDASRYELIRTREGGKIVAAAWYTQGLVYFARACVLDDSIKAGRCGRRMTLVFGPSGVVGVKHEGESIRCGSRVITRAAFNRTFPERGAVTEAEAWGDEAAKATGSLA